MAKMNENKKSPLVCILTWCGDMESLYGTLLTFKTLRVGFPTARVIVSDNASILSARPEIIRAATDAGCEYRQLDTPVSYNEYYSWALSHEAHDYVVIADPDLVFWRGMEDLRFQGLFAGRFMQGIVDGSQSEETCERLHPSLIFIPSARAFSERLLQVFQGKTYGYYKFSPFEPTVAKVGSRWMRWDTLAQLYAAMKEDAYIFTEGDLDSYDHLFCGTHISAMRRGATVDVIERAHDYAKNNIAALRGIWREQEQYFASLSEGDNGH